MELHMIWTAEGDDWQERWMLTAWDEYSVDGNHEGFCEELERLKKLNGGRIKVVIVRVDESELDKCFVVPVIAGTVQPEESE